MALFFAAIAYLTIVVPIGLFVWSWAFADKAQLDRMKDNERTRSMAAYAVHYDYQRAGWWNRRQFRNHIKRGADLL